MNRALEIPTRQPPGREEMLLKLLLLAAALVLFGPVFVVVTVWLAERSELHYRRRVRTIWAVLAVAGTFLFASLWSQVLAAYTDGFGTDSDSTSQHITALEAAPIGSAATEGAWPKPPWKRLNLFAPKHALRLLAQALSE